MGNDTMNDSEVIDWMFLLAPSNTQRRAIIQDLLKHKAQDCMSSDDIAACQRGLTLLNEPGRVPEAAGPWLSVKEEDLIEL